MRYVNSLHLQWKLRNKGKEQLVIAKSSRGRSRTGAVAYQNFPLQSLSESSNGLSQRSS